MILWRFMLSSMLGALLWVTTFVAGVVVLAVSVEKANDDWWNLYRAVRFQLLAILIWLSPLLVALAVSLSGVHRKSRGEHQALSCSGVGTLQLMPMAICVGVLVGVLGLAVGEWVLPIVAVTEPPTWIWTEFGPVRTTDGWLVPFDIGQAAHHVVSHDATGFNPRTSALSELLLNQDPASSTERVSRLSRLFACAGCALIGLLFDRFKHPIVSVALLCGALSLVDVIAWAMGAQGQIEPWLAGSVTGWLWVVPVWWTARQPST